MTALGDRLGDLSGEQIIALLAIVGVAVLFVYGEHLASMRALQKQKLARREMRRRMRRGRYRA